MSDDPSPEFPADEKPGRNRPRLLLTLLALVALGVGGYLVVHLGSLERQVRDLSLASAQRVQAQDTLANGLKTLAERQTHAEGEMRQQIEALRGLSRPIPGPDLTAISARLRQAESAVDRLALRGVLIGDSARNTEPPSTTGGINRAWAVVKAALGSLITIRSNQTAASSLLTVEEQKLRRQHLRLLLLEARVAVTRTDQSAYAAAITEARSWLEENFDTDDANVAMLARELNSLAGIDIAT